MEQENSLESLLKRQKVHSLFSAEVASLAQKRCLGNGWIPVWASDPQVSLSYSVFSHILLNRLKGRRTLHMIPVHNWMTRPKFWPKPRPNIPKTKPSKGWQKSQDRDRNQDFWISFAFVFVSFYSDLFFSETKFFESETETFLQIYIFWNRDFFQT